jgi:hypothetical protein
MDPARPSDLARLLGRLDERLRAVETGQAGEVSAGSTVFEPGTILSIGTGALLAVSGDVSTIGTGSGRAQDQFANELFTTGHIDDLGVFGTRLTASTQPGAAPLRGFVQVTNAGLDTPGLPTGVRRLATDTAVGVNAGTFTDCWVAGFPELISSGFQWRSKVVTPAGVTGQARLLYTTEAGGTYTSAVIALPANTTTTVAWNWDLALASGATITTPGANPAGTVALQTRVATGAGTINAAPPIVARQIGAGIIAATLTGV